MRWYLFQGSIVFAVVASNIHWQWTPNGYLASAIGMGVAFGVTAALAWIWDSSAAFRSRRQQATR